MTSDSVRTDGTSKLARYGDNALLGLIRGWRRIASQAAAAELAAVAEFSERRQAEAKTAGVWDSTAVNAADDEIAAALTMTSRSTQLLIDRAAALRQLPATAQALAAGKIDMPKTLVFINGLAGQDPGPGPRHRSPADRAGSRVDHWPASRGPEPRPASRRSRGGRAPAADGGEAGAGRKMPGAGRRDGQPVRPEPARSGHRGRVEPRDGSGPRAPPIGRFRDPGRAAGTGVPRAALRSGGQ